MSVFVVDDSMVDVPVWIVDLSSFRTWANSDDFPDTGRICFFNGKPWVDMSKEQLFSHNQVKVEYSRVLSNLVLATELGRYVGDGMRLSNPDANISVQPDGMFIAQETLKSGRVQFVEGLQGGIAELVGSPDMVLEVVRTSPVVKDKEVLRELYWQAGVREYWLVDARGKTPDFEILRHSSKGFVVTRKTNGWVKSAVFGKSFRIAQSVDQLGHPVYTLSVR